MDDLGFTYHVYKNSNVVIKHHGRTATTLRGQKARDFKECLESSSFNDLQHLMARLTGNYKRGNEKIGKNNPKN